MLNLADLIVEGMKETDDEYVISVTVKEEPPSTPSADRYSPQ